MPAGPCRHLRSIVPVVLSALPSSEEPFPPAKAGILPVVRLISALPFDRVLSGLLTPVLLHFGVNKTVRMGPILRLIGARADVWLTDEIKMSGQKKVGMPKRARALA